MKYNHIVQLLTDNFIFADDCTFSWQNWLTIRIVWLVPVRIYYEYP